MVHRGRGGIVLLSSIVAFQGAPNAAHYAATKAYVQTLSEGLHVELVTRPETTNAPVSDRGIHQWS
jgi:short-subunit dehydrogenase